MTRFILICLTMLLWGQVSTASLAISQEAATEDPAGGAEVVGSADDVGTSDDAETQAESDEAPVAGEEAESDRVNEAKERAKGVVDQTQEKVSEIAADVDEDERAIEAKTSILGPIYALAETMSFKAFHWLAFMFMVTGVVSFALQLVLGKLVALAKLGFSLTEILSDALGLVISLIGLVLTTQAAAENSTFTESAFAVISATVVGLVLGFIFYLWGQRQELQAIDARKARVTED